MCYFRALQKGDINKVVPIDKSSTVLTILLALIFLHEGVTEGKLFSVVLIGLGTMLMITRKNSQRADTGQTETHWLLYAVLSAVFASLTAILGKIGISGVDSNLGTAIRTSVMLAMAWLIVFLKQKQNQVAAIDKKELFFIILSGLATGVSWMCYYKALQEGPASVVVPIDKLSILVTIAFSRIVFHEKLTKKAAFIDGEFLDLRNDVMTYGEGFSFKGNFSFVALFYGMKINQDLIVFYGENPAKYTATLRYEERIVESGQRKGLITLEIWSYGYGIYLASNYIELPGETGEVGVCVVKNNMQYSVQAVNYNREKMTRSTK